MTIAKSLPLLLLPDHTQLPGSDSTFVFAERSGGKNFQEHSQSLLLTSSIMPILERLHPDGQYAITYGATCGYVWSEVTSDPCVAGREAIGQVNGGS